jgi:hypothetical protein
MRAAGKKCYRDVDGNITITKAVSFLSRSRDSLEKHFTNIKEVNDYDQG